MNHARPDFGPARRQRQRGRRRRARAGFSLLELLVAMAIMGILAGGALLLSTSALRLGSSLEKHGAEIRQDHAVLAALRENFSRLPLGVQVELRGGNLILHDCGNWATGQGIVLTGPVGAISLGGPEGENNALVLHWHLDLDGAPQLDEAGNPVPPVASASGLPELGSSQAQVDLLANLDVCQWQVGLIDATGALSWSTDYTPTVVANPDGTTTSPTPRLLEFQWSVEGVDEVRRAVFPLHIARRATPDAGSGEQAGGGGGGNQGGGGQGGGGNQGNPGNQGGAGAQGGPNNRGGGENPRNPNRNGPGAGRGPGGGGPGGRGNR